MTHSAELTVTNASAETVAVYRVSGSCECIAGEIEPKVIPPGHTAKAQVTFIGITGKGSYSGTAYLVTDEPGPCRYEIPIRGMVQEDLMIEPSVLKFGILSRNAIAFRDARLRRKDGKPILVKEVLGVGDPFEVTVSHSQDPAGGGYEIKAKMVGTRPGHFARQATLVTDCPTMPKVALALQGEVETDFRITPPIAAAKRVSETAFPSFEVVIENTKKESFKVRSVREGRNTPLEFTAGDLDGSRRTLAIRLTDVPKDGAPVGELLISVDREEEPLHLPYRVEEPAARPQGKP
jgi:hypothetical protein